MPTAFYERPDILGQTPLQCNEFRIIRHCWSRTVENLIIQLIRAIVLDMIKGLSIRKNLGMELAIILRYQTDDLTSLTSILDQEEKEI